MLVERAGAENEIGVERKGVDPVRVLRERPNEFALCEGFRLYEFGVSSDRCIREWLARRKRIT